MVGAERHTPSLTIKKGREEKEILQYGCKPQMLGNGKESLSQLWTYSVSENNNLCSLFEHSGYHPFHIVMLLMGQKRESHFPKVRISDKMWFPSKESLSGSPWPSLYLSENKMNRHYKIQRDVQWWKLTLSLRGRVFQMQMVWLALQHYLTLFRPVITSMKNVRRWSTEWWERNEGCRCWSKYGF